MKPSKSSPRKRGKRQQKPSSPSPPQSAAISNKSDQQQQQQLEEDDEEEEVQFEVAEVKRLADDEEEKKRALDVEWLMEAFSSLSLDQICCAYNEAGHDPFKAAGILGAQLNDPEGFESEIDAERKQNKKTTKKKNSGVKTERRKHKRIAASSGIVANVIGKEYVKPSLSSMSEVMAEYSNRGKDKAEVGDRHYSVEEGEEFLCSMLGDNTELGMGVVRDVLGQCGFNVEKALDTLLDISASSFCEFKARDGGYYSCLYPEVSVNGPPQSSINSSQALDTLLDISASSFCEFKARDGGNHSCLYPEVSIDGPPQSSIHSSQLKEPKDSTYHPFEEENHFLQCIKFGCREESRGFANYEEQLSSRARDVNPDLQQKVLESLFSIPEPRKHDPNSMNWKKVVKQVESFGQGLSYFNASITEPLLNPRNGKQEEYKVCRRAARKQWDTMRTYYLKAANAYSHGERAHAAHLSEKGKFHSKLAREADEKASKEIFEARNKDIKNTVIIDLHGQHVKEGIGLLKLHLLLFTYIPSIQFLKVITGCGVDTDGRGKLKRSVISLVKKEGIEWCEENSGSLLLRLDGLKEYNFMEGDDDSDDLS